MTEDDAIEIVAARSGRTIEEVRAILDGVNNLKRKGEPDFQLVRSVSFADGGEMLFQSDDGVWLSIWTKKNRNGEYSGKSEWVYYNSNEGNEPVGCSSWQEAIARRSPEPAPPPPRVTFSPKVVSATRKGA